MVLDSDVKAECPWTDLLRQQQAGQLLQSVQGRGQLSEEPTVHRRLEGLHCGLHQVLRYLRG